MLNRDFYIGHGDTLDSLVAVLYEEDGVTPVDLTGKTVTFSMHTELGAEVIEDAEAEVVGDPLEGRVAYHWAEGDTDTPGTFFGRFVVTSSDGRFSAPNEDAITVHITQF